MRRVEPKVFLVGETGANRLGMLDYLRHVGGEDGVFSPSQWKVTEGELLVEFMGRLCYRSWKPGLNPNVTKVREGNKTYLANILEVGHGSVLEHATLSFVLADVSRVFTHELVRHRVGVAISQESLRFVRLTDLGLWLPSCVRDPELAALFERAFSSAEELQRELAKRLEVDEGKRPFAEKKELTSAMRRVAPDGLATTIGWTANVRTLRHVIQLRTSPGAEEEARLVLGMVAKVASERWPNLFQDATVLPDGQWTFPHGSA